DQHVARRDTLGQRRNAPIRERLFDDDQRFRCTDAVHVDRNQMLTFEHAAAALAPLARRLDQLDRLFETRILRRADARHRAQAQRLAGAGRGAVFAAPFDSSWNNTSSCLIMPSSPRARSSIASEPVFKSRTSASSASLRALSFSFASRCCASWRSYSRTCSQPPLPSHIGYWSTTINAIRV